MIHKLTGVDENNAADYTYFIDYNETATRFFLHFVRRIGVNAISNKSRNERFPRPATTLNALRSFQAVVYRETALIDVTK